MLGGGNRPKANLPLEWSLQAYAPVVAYHNKRCIPVAKTTQGKVVENRFLLSSRNRSLSRSLSTQRVMPGNVAFHFDQSFR